MNQQNGKFRRQLLFILASSAAIAVLNLLGLVVIARALGAHTVGIYAACVVSVDLGFSLVNFGFNQAVIRNGAALSVHRAALTCVFAQAILAIIGWSSVVLVQVWTGHDLFPFAAWLPAAILSLRVVNTFSTLLYSEYEADLNYGTISRVQVAAAALANAVGIASALAAPNLMTLLARDVTNTGAVLVFFWFNRREGLTLSSDLAEIKRVIVFARKVWTLNLLETLCARMDSFLVSRLLGMSAMGSYYTSRAVCDGIASFLIKPVQTLFFAKYCQVIGAINPGEGLQRFAVPYFSVLIVGAVGASYVSEPLVIATFGKTFSGMGSVIPWLLIGGGAVVWYENAKVMALASGSSVSAIAARASQAICIVAFGLLLIPTYGAVGAAMAFALSAFVLSFVMTLHAIYSRTAAAG